MLKDVRGAVVAVEDVQRLPLQQGEIGHPCLSRPPQGAQVGGVHARQRHQNRIIRHSCHLLGRQAFLRQAVEQRQRMGEGVMPGARVVAEQGVDLGDGVAVKAGLTRQRLPTAGSVQVLPEVVQQGRRSVALSFSIEAPVHDQPLAKGMYRADIHLGDVVGSAGEVAGDPNQRPQPLFELPGGFFGEGREEDRLRRHAVENDQVGRAPEQHACLAGTRSRRQIERAAHMQDGGALGGIGLEADLCPKLLDDE